MLDQFLRRLCRHLVASRTGGARRGLSFVKDRLFDPFDRDARPLQPLGERTRTFAIGAGLILVGCGVMLLVTAIQAHVWEGESIVGARYFGPCAVILLSI